MCMFIVYLSTYIYIYIYTHTHNAGSIFIVLLCSSLVSIHSCTSVHLPHWLSLPSSVAIMEYHCQQ